ncbi:DUF3105 domain-containing protein [Glycomyces sp. L485]|uniref:DUF3105 domain-containing protein n=1 Tax=Glycomyces sp. L485 TaxID=2909235 RepID=UPI001F4B8993|nr:DUF3105 domain-containing protein [Glycomyces sp. L485]MCH7231413.1 DUF3105 domain-containing protein [Glycomyces sp. L485]
MAPKKQNSSKSGKGSGSKSAKNAGRKGPAVQVRQPKPWGLILTFSGVGVVAIGLIVAAAFVVWDRSQAPEGVTNFYGEYENYSTVSEALDDGEVTEEDLEHPWVVQQTHVDSDPAWDGTNPTYELTPPAGGNHLGNWQNCEGTVYNAPIVDGNAVHSLEHGAVWLTYDPELVDEDQAATLSGKISGRNYSFMSPYPSQGVAVSLQSWGNQYQTDDVDDPKIDEYLNHYIQNGDNLAEMNATCGNGVSTTTADAAGGETEMSEEEMTALLEEMETADSEGEG